VSGYFILTRPTQYQFARRTWRQLFCDLAQFLCLFGKTFLEAFELFETTALYHGMLRSIPSEEGGSATGVLITDEGQELCGDMV
jgi:hypothetical protein